MGDAPASANEGLDVGEFCRRVEEYLARANEGHLVRIVGAGFELVRQWATEGVPFSVVCRGIDLKAERHRAGRSTRPLRIEFCESDVRAVFQDWKRAVGVAGQMAREDDDEEHARRPSVTKQLERMVRGLTRAAGRLEMPADVRDEVTRILEAVVVLQETNRGRRRVQLDDVSQELARCDRQLMAAARAAAGADELDRCRAEAAAELGTYRSRMPTEAWARSVEVATDRLLRDRLHLPVLEL